MITVVDSETDQVIRQIPPDELMAVASKLATGGEEADHRGVLVQETV